MAGAGKGRREIDWDEQPLGKMSDGKIASLLGVTPQAVRYARKRRGIPPAKPQRGRCDPASFVDQLGKKSDREVAERFGLTVGQVSHARRRLGIRPRRIDWNEVPELGTVPDIVVARKYGVDNKVVAKARWMRAISKWQEGRLCPCGENFVAFHMRQRYCSHRCQRYHWQLVHKNGMSADAADCGIAMRAYRATLAKRTKGVADVDDLA